MLPRYSDKVDVARVAGRARDEYVALMNNLGMPLPEKIQEALQANESSIDDHSVKLPSFAQLTQVRQLAPLDLQARLSAANPPILLDVREPDEFTGELGHVTSSFFFPLRHLSERATELEKSSRIARSSQSAALAFEALPRLRS